MFLYFYINGILTEISIKWEILLPIHPEYAEPTILQSIVTVTQTMEVKVHSPCTTIL